MMNTRFAEINRHTAISIALCITGLTSVNANADIVTGLVGTAVNAVMGNSSYGVSNFPECILARMPGAATDDVANQISAECSKEYSLGTPIQKDAGLFHAFNSANDCYQQKTKNTASIVAQQTIQFSCSTLY